MELEYILTVITLWVGESVEDVGPREVGPEWLVSGDGWFWVSLNSVALGRLSGDAVGGVMLDPLSTGDALPRGLSEGVPSVSRVFTHILVCVNCRSEKRFSEQSYQPRQELPDQIQI